MTPEQISERLEAIEAERIELAEVDHREQMRRAVIDGGDLDAIERQQADTQRRDERLAIEAEALQEMLPTARTASVQPQMDELLAKHADLMAKAGKASSTIVKQWGQITKAIEQFKACYTESMALTGEAQRIAKAAGAEQSHMGPPLSPNLYGLVDRMKSEAGEMGFAASGYTSGPKPNDFGINVDKVAS